MNFNAFWKWLCKNEHLIQNLGNRNRSFKIHAQGNCGYCIPQSTGRTHLFSKGDAQQTWDRYRNFSGHKHQQMSSSYALPNKKKKPLPQNWMSSPNKTCCPWIAAAIRGFFAGQKQTNNKQPKTK